jgi:hypothetical protein
MLKGPRLNLISKREKENPSLGRLNVYSILLYAPFTRDSLKISNLFKFTCFRFLNHFVNVVNVTKVFFSPNTTMFSPPILMS